MSVSLNSNPLVLLFAGAAVAVFGGVYVLSLQDERAHQAIPVLQKGDGILTRTSYAKDNRVLCHVTKVRPKPECI